MYLAASGIGSILIHDHDVIEDSNLQRQIAFTTADIGRNKAEVLAERLRMLNPLISVTARATFSGVDSIQPGVKVILDCSDNFGTRATVNRASCEAGLPLVSGAAIRSEGQVCVFDPTVSGSPCYHCLFGDLTAGESAEPASCAESGVLSPLVGVIGSLQATETIKVVLGRHADSLGKLLIYDATGLGFRQLRFTADPACPVCGVCNK
jgi:adenylyltransferase/sulfurtransferase